MESQKTHTSVADREFSFADYPMGVTLSNGMTVFRVFAPNAGKVDLELFEYYEQTQGHLFKMARDDEGHWNLRVDQELANYCYGYHITPKNPDSSGFISSPEVAADPYSKHVIVRNNYRQNPKTFIAKPSSYDWEGDDFNTPSDPRDLVIYEAHLKDLTAHSSSNARGESYYSRFFDPRQRGGINHLKKLGVNAIEFLPLHHFSYFEPPYQQRSRGGIRNTWNPYSRNYWGYMTTFFFAPHLLYASDAKYGFNAVNGGSDVPQREFKDLIKKLHREGFCVILDVVYNHVSQYDLNPLKQIDRDYYFRLDSYGHLKSESGCGNDFKTEAPKARQLIIDSITYWMEEFHIDGFRFDLAKLIDWQTLKEIRDEARKINPNVILIAEPWGGGYAPKGFSHQNYAAWNDQIRNGVKGSHPKNDRGYIFGEWQGDNNRFSLENYFRGTLENAENGLFAGSQHSLNYLESHDGYTLGDFIRIGLKPEMENTRIRDIKSHTRLTGQQLSISKLAALYLFTSQGIAMISEGQEYGRSKVIAPAAVNDPKIGYMDHNSYEKDNETNFLNFDHISLNEELFEYYRGLIKLRMHAPALRKAEPLDVIFKPYKNAHHITFYLKGENARDPYDYFISLNAHRKNTFYIELPEGYWDLIVNGNRAGTQAIATISGSMNIPPSSGVVLRKLRG